MPQAVRNTFSVVHTVAVGSVPETPFRDAQDVVGFRAVESVIDPGDSDSGVLQLIVQLLDGGGNFLNPTTNTRVDIVIEELVNLENPPNTPFIITGSGTLALRGDLTAVSESGFRYKTSFAVRVTSVTSLPVGSATIAVLARYG